MPKASRVTVTMTPTRLDVFTETDRQANTDWAPYRGDGQTVIVRPRGSSIFTGGPDVTAATGFEQFAEEAIGRKLLPGDALYAIVPSGSVIVHVEQIGV